MRGVRGVQRQDVSAALTFTQGERTEHHGTTDASSKTSAPYTSTLGIRCRNAVCAKAVSTPFHMVEISPTSNQNCSVLGQISKLINPQIFIWMFLHLNVLITFYTREVLVGHFQWWTPLAKKLVVLTLKH